jgi:hypothetical protein
MSTTITYTYDKSRRLQSQASSTGETHYFTFNQRNMVTQIQDFGGSDANRYFTYNGLGERVFGIDGTTTPSYWAYDRGRLVRENQNSSSTHYRHNAARQRCRGSLVEVILADGASTACPATDHLGTLQKLVGSGPTLPTSSYEFTRSGERLGIGDLLGGSPANREQFAPPLEVLASKMTQVTHLLPVGGANLPAEGLSVGGSATAVSAVDPFAGGGAPDQGHGGHGAPQCLDADDDDGDNPHIDGTDQNCTAPTCCDCKIVNDPSWNPDRNTFLTAGQQIPGAPAGTVVANGEVQATTFFFELVCPAGVVGPCTMSQRECHTWSYAAHLTENDIIQKLDAATKAKKTAFPAHRIGSYRYLHTVTVCDLDDYPSTAPGVERNDNPTGPDAATATASDLIAYDFGARVVIDQCETKYLDWGFHISYIPAFSWQGRYDASHD